jgi:hypothetical protein
MMITKRPGASEFFTRLLSKGAWVMVKRNEGGIKVETPQAGPDSPTGGISNARIEETLIKTKPVKFLTNFCIS